MSSKKHTELISLKSLTPVYIWTGVIVIAQFYMGFAILNGCADAESRLKLRVMSFNIRYGLANDGPNAWEHRWELVFNVLRDHGADVVGLQEALRFQLDEIRTADGLNDYAEIGVGRDDGREGGEYTALLYRKDRFHLRNHGTFWLSATPDIPSRSWDANFNRICTWALLSERESNNQFLIYNVHLDHESQLSRKNSVKLLIRHISEHRGPHPVVLIGDFNAGEDNEIIRFLAGEQNLDDAPNSVVFADTYRSLHPNAIDAGTFGAWTGEVDGPKIDFVFVDRQSLGAALRAEIIHYNEDGAYPSDHYPVLADIELRE